jgi:hypothetical protein
MPPPRGIAMMVSTVLRQEMERIEKKSAETGLDDAELERVQKLLAISKLLTGEASVTESTLDMDKLVEDLRPSKDPVLFPKKGPKSTAKVHEPES